MEKGKGIWVCHPLCQDCGTIREHVEGMVDCPECGSKGTTISPKQAGRFMAGIGLDYPQEAANVTDKLIFFATGEMPKDSKLVYVGEPIGNAKISAN